MNAYMSKIYYSISDLARELDITTRAIRFYEEQGMLAPERRGQERIYSAKDRVALKLILRGKRIGFSLAECKELIELYDPAGGNRKQLDTFMEKLYKKYVPSQTREYIESMAEPEEQPRPRPARSSRSAAPDTFDEKKGVE